MKIFNNPGTTIKNVAKIMFFLETVGSVIAGIVSASDEGDFIYFFAIAVGGVIIAYISNLFLVAFGELVEKATSIDSKLKGNVKEETFKLAKKETTLEDLLEKGIISKDEYDEAVKNNAVLW